MLETLPTITGIGRYRTEMGFRYSEEAMFGLTTALSPTAMTDWWMPYMDPPPSPSLTIT